MAWRYCECGGEIDEPTDVGEIIKCETFCPKCGTPMPIDEEYRDNLLVTSIERVTWLENRIGIIEQYIQQIVVNAGGKYN